MHSLNGFPYFSSFDQEEKKKKEGKPSKMKAVEMTVENQSYCVRQKSQKQE